MWPVKWGNHVHINFLLEETRYENLSMSFKEIFSGCGKTRN